ncbi:MAG: APC family permease [Lachnospiraceae bacterium]|nr:APC family permease [Lachnospiraceae bacterium]
MAENKLSRMDLFSMAIGQIIGVGIMTMTGIAIGFTGRSVNLAYIFAGLITVVAAIPQIYIGGTANFIGGQYSQIAVLGNKKLAGIFIYIQIAMTLALSMYTLSFSEYFLSLFSGANVRLISFVVLTILVAMHIMGIKQAARLQNIMCIILAVAIASYVVFGIGSIQPGYMKMPDFATGGVTGFILASIYLTFAAGGATYIVNFSAEAKNPTKDIPFVIIVSTTLIVVLYAVMSTIAAGVLPVAEVANKPLSISAASFMPKAVYTFFVVGGAMFALLTTLNFTIGMMVYPMKKASEDGWLPKGLAVTNKKYGTPHFVLLVIYLIGLLPILFGLDLSTIANSTVILTTSIRGVIAFVAMALPKKIPELWEKSAFHTDRTKLNIICIIAIILAGVSVAMLLATTSMPKIIGNCSILAVSVILAFIFEKKVEIKASYTEK